MIKVQDVLRDMPHFETFCSVEKLHTLVERLREDPRFAIEVAGTSVNGLPIHHVRFGTGSVKALLVAGPHCMEPIGGLTVFSLMTMLHDGSRPLLEADVEWHIVPCIDPDGALLNEGWTQKPFTLESQMRHFYMQAYPDQVDTSFPIRYKKLAWNAPPSQEARILQGLIERVRPDFYFSLHNAWTGGAQYFLNRNIDRKYHQDLYGLLERLDFPIQKRPVCKEVCAPYGGGIVEMFSIKKHYDFMERTLPDPEKWVPYGAASWDYLEEVNPNALSFLAELGYVRHPDDESEKDTGQNLRQFRLRLEADSKYLATVLLEEWEKVKAEVDTASPVHRAIAGGVVLPEKEKLCEGGLPVTVYPTRDTLFNPHYDKTMTEGDRFDTCIVDGGFFFARMSYPLVRLLKESRQTPAVRSALERVEQAFDEALAEIKSHVDFDAFETVDCDTLAKVQLGSGLIVLNSVLEQLQRA